MSMFSYSLLASGGTLAPDSLPGLRPWTCWGGPQTITVNYFLSNHSLVGSGPL